MICIKYINDKIPFNCFAICKRAPNLVTPYTVVITVCLITLRLTNPSKHFAIRTSFAASLERSLST